MAVNPYPGDPDFKYLGLEKQVLMEQQSAPYDGKKNFWVPDEKEGYVKADLQSTEGDKCNVQTEKGEVNGLR